MTPTLSTRRKPRTPPLPAALGREVRFGLSLLGLLLAMLGVAVYVKMERPACRSVEAEVAAADGDQEGSAEETLHAAAGELQPPSAEAMPVPAHEDTSATKPLWENDRVADRHDVTPPADMPLPVGTPSRGRQRASCRAVKATRLPSPIRRPDRSIRFRPKAKPCPKMNPPPKGHSPPAPAFCRAPPDGRGAWRENVRCRRTAAEMSAEPSLPPTHRPTVPRCCRAKRGMSGPVRCTSPDRFSRPPASNRRWPSRGIHLWSPLPRDRFAAGARADDLRGGDSVDEGPCAALGRPYAAAHGPEPTLEYARRRARRRSLRFAAGAAICRMHARRCTAGSSMRRRRRR